MKNKNKLIIILVIAVGLAAFLYIVSSNTNSSKKLPTGTMVKHYDPVSGETDTTLSGVAPETAGQGPSGIYFSGFSKLLDSGLTSDQVTAAENTLRSYPDFAKANRISLAVKEIQLARVTDPADPMSWSATSRIAINEKTFYKIIIEYGGVYSVHVFVYATSGALLYDSGLIGPNNVD